MNQLNRAYKSLLRLYPLDYRARFAAEMLATFQQTAIERRKQGSLPFTRFASFELLGLLAGSEIEWLEKLLTDRSVRGRHLPDLRMMRPPGVPKEIWFAAAGRPEEIEQ